MLSSAQMRLTELYLLSLKQIKQQIGNKTCRDTAEQTVEAQMVKLQLLEAFQIPSERELKKKMYFKKMLKAFLHRSCESLVQHK